MASVDVSQFTDDEVAQFKADLEEQLKRITDYLREQLAGAVLGADGKLIVGDPRNVQLAKEIGDRLATDMEEMFGGQAAKAFRALSGGIVQVVQGDLGEQGLPDAFTLASADTLTAHVDGTLTDLTSLGGDAASALRSVVVAMFRTSITPDDLLDTLAGKLGASVAEATTLVDTTTMALDRSVVVAQSQSSGVQWFLYDGPEDQLTRPWCDPRVGMLFHQTELDEEPNDVGPQPPSQYGGGWRCRHRWVPVRDDDAQNYPRWQNRSYSVGENA